MTAQYRPILETSEHDRKPAKHHSIESLVLVQMSIRRRTRNYSEQEVLGSFVRAVLSWGTFIYHSNSMEKSQMNRLTILFGVLNLCVELALIVTNIQSASSSNEQWLVSPQNVEKQNVPAENSAVYEQNCPQAETETTAHRALELTERQGVSSSSTNACEQEEHTLRNENPSSQYRQKQSHIPEPNTCTYVKPTDPGREGAQPDTQATPQEVQVESSNLTTEDRTSCDEMDVDDKTYNSCKLFMMDSGACAHSTNDPSVLISYPAHLNLKPHIASISGFGGTVVTVERRGYIDGPGGKLHSVLYVPGSTANVVSVGELTWDYPVKVEFYKDKFWIEECQTGQRIGEGHRHGNSNHYVVDRLEPESVLGRLNWSTIAA